MMTFEEPVQLGLGFQFSVSGIRVFRTSRGSILLTSRSDLILLPPGFGRRGLPEPSRLSG